MSTQGVEEEGLDFEAEEDDLMDEDGADLQQQQILPKLKSAITATAVTKKTKGRGFREEAASTRLASHGFHSLDSDPGPGPERSIEGWIILVTGVHEEAQEDNLQEEFGEFGYIKNLHLNLDRRTGFVKEFESKVIAVLETLACRSKTIEKKGKIALFAESYSRELNIESASNGYALIEYEEFEDAQKAIKAMDGAELLTQTINVDWAFSRGPFKSKNVRRGGPRRQRSRSPIRKH